MTASCTHWADLSDRQVLGETLTAPDQQFLKQHEQECAACGQEAALLRELRPSPLHAVPDEEEVQRILEQAELDAPGTKRGPSIPSFWLRRSTPWAAAAAGTLALAASLLLYARGESKPATAMKATAAAPVGKAQEDSCGALVEGVVVCLTAGSEVGRIDLTSKERTLQLLSGRALVAIKTPISGSSFTVITRAGSASGAAAVFSVEVRPDQGVWARATRGAVGVRSTDGDSEQTVLAGQELRFGSSAASAITVQDAERDARLLSRWGKVMGGNQP